MFLDREDFYSKIKMMETLNFLILIVILLLGVLIGYLLGKIIYILLGVVIAACIGYIIYSIVDLKIDFYRWCLDIHCEMVKEKNK